MRVVGIESSCDETAAAIVDDGRRVASTVVASQVALHARFGGVVPEIASRAHVEAIGPIVKQALDEAGATLDSIDAIAATRGPGLAGCLLVGLEFAKGLALRHNKPLVAVHHIGGHVYSPWLGRQVDAWGASVEEAAPFEPYLALIVSGGHSSLIRVDDWARYAILGETMDDAVGEAYDKVAKVMGLGYPGGPLMDQLAARGNDRAIDLPMPLSRHADRDTMLDFSFSGLKTAVSRLVDQERRRTHGAPLGEEFVANVAASFQRVAVEALLDRAERALNATGLRRLAIAGGVACNRGLRAQAQRRFAGLALAFPAPEFCTDNAAMIAGLGWHVARSGHRATLSLNIAPSLALGGDWQQGE